MRALGLAAQCLAAMMLWSVAAAHEIRPAVATIAPGADGSYRMVLAVNIEALLAKVSVEHRDTDESPNAREYNRLRVLAPQALQPLVEAELPTYLEGIELAFDGRRVRPAVARVDIPEVGNAALSRVTLLHLSGTMPHAAKSLTLRYDPRHGACVLRVAEGERVDALWLRNGERSATYVMGRGFDRRAAGKVFKEYLALGFTHIVPLGLDHILFVLGLFLLSTRLTPLLIQVTAFSVAHTITLALSVYGVVSLPPAIVEPLIAASIVYVAVENMLTSKLKPWRALVVFCFGLLHGLGFAGVLTEVGLPPGQFVPALVSFNAGVELGQLTVITLAYFAVGFWARTKSWYRARVVVPGSAAVAAVGLFWTVQRVLGG